MRGRCGKDWSLACERICALLNISLTVTRGKWRLPSLKTKTKAEEPLGDPMDCVYMSPVTLEFRQINDGVAGCQSALLRINELGYISAATRV